MAIDKDLLSKIAETVKQDFETLQRVESLTEILLVSIYEEHPDTLRDFFLKNGVTQEEFAKMSVEDVINKSEEIWSKKSTRMETLIVALDLLFEARYGWQEGTVSGMQAPNVLLALQHAMEYDNPNKPSIWDITK